MKAKLLRIVALVCVLSMTLVAVPVMATGASGTGPASVAAGTVGTANTGANIRNSAGGGSVIGSVPKGAMVNIQGTSGLWYRITYGSISGYVYYEYITVTGDTATPAPDSNPVTDLNTTGTITGNSVNVRKGPGTGYGTLGKLTKNAKVTVTGSSGDWYRINYSGKTGYVSIAYVKLGGDVQPASSAAPTSANATVRLGGEGETVKLRSGAGTGYSEVGTVSHGDRLIVVDASSTWYKVNYNGNTVYINGAYVQMDSAPAATPTPAATASPQASTAPAASSQPTGDPVKGTITASSLNVRSGPSASSSSIGKLAKGSSVTVLGSTGSWYAIDYSGKTGYVSKNYVKVSGTVPSLSASPAASVSPNASATPAGNTNATVEVEGGGSLNVRKGPSTDYEKLGKVSDGQRVYVTGSSGNWYAFDFNGQSGYISKNFVVLDKDIQLMTTPTPGVESSNVGTVTATTLNVRSGAGTNYTIIGKLKHGASVTVLATTGAWYKVNCNGTAGYVSAQYVSMSNGNTTPTTSSAPSANEMVNRTLDIETTLQQGDSGDKVMDLQKALTIHGFYSGSIDGTYGASLKSAVSSFQKAVGLDVDGVAGNYTLATAYTLLDPLPKSSLNFNAYSNGSNIPIIKPTWSEANTLLPRKASFIVVDVRTGYTFACIRTGGSKHADVETATREDTNIMYYAIGTKWSWERRPVWVVYNGIRMAASMNCQPHGYETVGKNDMTGQFCIHFVDSRTHGSDSVDAQHQACIDEAYKAGQ